MGNDTHGDIINCNEYWYVESGTNGSWILFKVTKYEDCLPNDDDDENDVYIIYNGILIENHIVEQVYNDFSFSTELLPFLGRAKVYKHDDRLTRFTSFEQISEELGRKLFPYILKG